MAVAAVPYVIQTGSHGAQLFRQAISTLISPAGGVVNSGDYLITAQGSPNMTVNAAGGVPGGQAWVPGTSSSGIQGLYYVYNDATVIQTISASNPTNPRIDISVLQVQDQFYAGSTNLASLAIVTGTPAGSPVQPTTPVSSLLLAAIAVAANATTIVTANITDKRVFAMFGPTGRFTSKADFESAMMVGSAPAGFQLIEKMGNGGFTASSGIVLLNFSTAFPNGIGAVFVTAVSNSGAVTCTVGSANLSLGGFEVYITLAGAAYSGAISLYWRAVGC